MYVLFVLFYSHASCDMYTEKFVAENKDEAEEMAKNWLYDYVSGYSYYQGDALQTLFEKSFYDIIKDLHQNNTCMEVRTETYSHD